MTIPVKYLFTLLVLFAATMFTPARSQVIERLRNGEKQKIVVYGTSLSASVEGWATLLEDTLNARYPGKAEVINSAQAAMWSTWGVENLRERVLEHKPDLVLIEFAINDAYLPYGTSVEAARLNLKYMVRRIWELYPACMVFIQVMNMPVAEHKKQRPDIELYYAMYREEAEILNVGLIDHSVYWTPLLEKGENEFYKYVPDGIHPSLAAQQELVLPHLLKALGVEDPEP